MSLNIDVANVGPIRHARLSLGKLNVLIGTNDTGKTFFTTVVHRLLASRSEAYFPNRDPADMIPDNIVESVETILTSLGRYEGQPTDVDLRIDDNLRAWANDINKTTLQRYGQASRRGIAYAYGLPIERLRRQPVSYSKHESYVSVENLYPRWSVTIPMDVDIDCILTCPDPDDWIRSVFSPKNVQQFSSYPSYSDPRLIDRDGDITPRQRVRELCGQILYFLGDTTLFGGWPGECLHLPSERGGIMQSYRAITSAALRKITVAGIEPIDIDPLDGTARDFLSFVISPESERRFSRTAAEVFVGLASEIEDKLRAEISIIRSPTGIDRVVVTTPEGQFQLNQSSSMVSEISALVLALKHRVRAEDLLTIDEPEAHLHPEMQIEIAKLLVSLASADLSICLTTHSDYFVEQINNAIRSSELMTDNSESVLSLSSQISYDDVRALLFVRSDDGCLADDAMGDRIDPIQEDTFTTVSRRQYDESVPLIKRLLERSRTARELAE